MRPLPPKTLTRRSAVACCGKNTSLAHSHPGDRLVGLCQGPDRRARILTKIIIDAPEGGRPICRAMKRRVVTELTCSAVPSTGPQGALSFGVDSLYSIRSRCPAGFPGWPTGPSATKAGAIQTPRCSAAGRAGASTIFRALKSVLWVACGKQQTKADKRRRRRGSGVGRLKSGEDEARRDHHSRISAADNWRGCGNWRRQRLGLLQMPGCSTGPDFAGLRCRFLGNAAWRGVYDELYEARGTVRQRSVDVITYAFRECAGGTLSADGFPAAAGGSRVMPNRQNSWKNHPGSSRRKKPKKRTFVEKGWRHRVPAAIPKTLSSGSGLRAASRWGKKKSGGLPPGSRTGDRL